MSLLRVLLLFTLFVACIAALEPENSEDIVSVYIQRNLSKTDTITTIKQCLLYEIVRFIKTTFNKICPGKCKEGQNLCLLYTEFPLCGVSVLERFHCSINYPTCTLSLLVAFQPMIVTLTDIRHQILVYLLTYILTCYTKMTNFFSSISVIKKNIF